MSGHDRITGLSVPEGVLIRLTALDANKDVAGDQAFTFIVGLYSRGPGKGRGVGGVAQILENVNTDLRADFTIRWDAMHILATGNTDSDSDWMFRLPNLSPLEFPITKPP